ncbi:MAG: PTS sugar transporter subunit IIA [Longicatena sp.]
MDTNVIVIEDCVETWEDAIQRTAKELYNKGFVKEEFGEHCILREKVFPTGLNTEIPIAIPHTESEFVNASAICFLRLKKPVNFISMEDNEHEVPAQYVLNLAIKESKKQVPMLAKVIETFQDTKFLKELATKELPEFEVLLRSRLAK